MSFAKARNSRRLGLFENRLWLGGAIVFGLSGASVASIPIYVVGLSSFSHCVLISTRHSIVLLSLSLVTAFQLDQSGF